FFAVVFIFGTGLFIASYSRADHANAAKTIFACALDSFECSVFHRRAITVSVDHQAVETPGPMTDETDTIHPLSQCGIDSVSGKNQFAGWEIAMDYSRTPFGFPC